nr:protease complex subunit PrcB family protein [uncultured Sellimonas sp.]
MLEKVARIRKKFLFGLLVLFVLCLTGCSVTDLGGEKRQELDFTVVEKEDIPEELKTSIEEKKEKPFKLTYTDQGRMYIARGYGKKQTSGYSIKVTDVYETEQAIHIRTELEGPGERETVIQKSTYPYTVIRLDDYGRSIVFEE